MTSHRPLRVAHVTAESGFSGGEVQLFLLLEGLRKRGHDDVLLCPPGSEAEREARRRGFETLAVTLRSDWSLAGALALSRRLREAAPDLAHLHSGRAAWLGGLAAARVGLPALATRRMDRRLRRNPRNALLHGRLLRRSVAISEAVARQLADAGAPAARIALVPSAVDPAALHPQRAREQVRAELGARAGEPCLLTAASLVERKGIDVLLRALARLSAEESPPTLWIAGGGPERGALLELARQLALGDRVRFLGARRDLPDLLAACDVFVLPSRHEGLGVAALEAMAAGRAVVASRVGGLAEAVAHERTGLLVPPDDPPALAGALARLLGDARLRERLAAAGPARIAERHLASHMVEAYERLYRDVLAERPQAGARRVRA
jgi:glycosyltransferase involved in cell wall biosynthesis